MLFIYPILVLSTASVRYTETIHRVTTVQTFDATLFGSGLADSLGALGFLLLSLNLTFRSIPIRLASIAIFGVGIAFYVSGSIVLEVSGIATLPSLIVILVALRSADRRTGKASSSKADYIDVHRIVAAFLIIITILEIGAAVRWITYPFFPTVMYGDPSWKFAELESALFHSLGLMSPLLIILIAFSFFYKWYILNVFKRIIHALQGYRDSRAAPVSHERTTETMDGQINSKYKQDSIFNRDTSDTPVVATYAAKISTVTSRNVHWMIVSIALVSAALLTIYPHLSGVNPTGSGVSTDEQYYMNWMSKLRGDVGAGWTDIIANAFTINKGDRPLTLLTIITIANLTGSPDLMIIRYLPVALAPMLVLANYVLLRFSLRSKDDGKGKFYASLGAIFAAFSPQIVVGEYAGLLANWLALVAAYFAFYFLIKGWESKNRDQMIYAFGILFALLLVMMLIHLYTWTHLLTIILVFSMISYVLARKSVPNSIIKVFIMLAIIGTAFLIDYVKSSYFVTPTAAGSGSAIENNAQPQETNGRWERLFFTLNTYVGGFLSNPALLLPAVFWMVKSDLSKGVDRLLLSMFFILAVPITFGSIEFQTRVMYNIPLHIPALLILYYGANKFKDGRTNFSHLLPIITIVLTLVTYAFRAMTNLYLELPEGYVLEDQFLLQ